MKCWGQDSYGQLGNDSTVAHAQTPVNVAGLLSGVAGVAAGGGHTCALTVAGDVMCWGWDANGQLGNDAALTTKYTPVVVAP